MHDENRGTFVKRYAIIYLATALVMLPLDLLFLGVLAKGFFASQIGALLGEVKLAPAVLFYLIYVGGIVLFVNGAPGTSWQSALMLWGAVRTGLLRDFRAHRHVDAERLDLAGGRARHELGRGRDGRGRHAGVGVGELGAGENRSRHCERSEAIQRARSAQVKRRGTRRSSDWIALAATLRSQ